MTVVSGLIAENTAGLLGEMIRLQAEAQSNVLGGESILSWVFLILGMGLIFYFFSWKPEMNAQKQHQSMVSALKKGDEVMLKAGIYGKIHEVSDKCITVEISRDVRIRVSPLAIGSLVSDVPGKQDAAGESK